MPDAPASLSIVRNTPAPQGYCCASCGCDRAAHEPVCTQCGEPVPAGGWTRLLGTACRPLEGLLQWGVDARLRPQGPVRRQRMRRLEGPPGDAVLSAVSDPQLQPVFLRRSEVLRESSHRALQRPLAVGPFGRLDPQHSHPRLSQLPAPLSPDEARTHASELADALTVAHSRGLTHGRVCPDTVVTIPEHGQHQAVLTGFPGVPAGPWLTGVAPEVVRGADADPRSDVFGLGLVLVAMLTGQDPTEDGPSGWLDSRPGPAVAVDDNIGGDGELRDLIRQMLDRDPAQRPTLAAVRTALGGAAPAVQAAPAPVPVAAAAAPVPPSGAPSPALTRWLPVLAAAGLLLVGGGAALIAAPLLTASPEPTAQALQQAPTAGPAPAATAPATPAPAEVATEAATATAEVPEPSPASKPAPEPESEMEAVSEPAATPEPRSAAPAPAAPEPAATPEPEPAATPEPEPAATPEPAAVPEPQPETTADAASAAPEAATPEPEPEPEQTEAPEDAVADATVDEPAATAPEPAAAAEPEPEAPPPNPAVLGGTWSGTAMGRPASLHLVPLPDGTLTGTVSIRVGSRTTNYGVRGRYRLDGDGVGVISLAADAARSQWSGRLQGGRTLSGKVAVSGRPRGEFAFSK